MWVIIATDGGIPRVYGVWSEYVKAKAWAETNLRGTQYRITRMIVPASTLT